MKYIIMCGGKYKAWEGEPRQLTQIHGEPVVARTIRLLRENGVDDIAISTNDRRFEQFGVPVLRHCNLFETDHKTTFGSWVDCFYTYVRSACYLMGDVVFSPEAIRTIVETETKSIQFFASCPPFAPEYIKRYAEPFAFKVQDMDRFRAAIEFVDWNTGTGIFKRHPIAWELWQVINGWNVNEINYGSYVVINDYTCDIDRPEDAERIAKCIT